MSHWKTAFPGRYLQVSDVDTPITATIQRASVEQVGGENGEARLTVRFEEPGIKALILNQTRAEAVAEVAGSDDTDRWPGTRIRIIKGQTRYQGRKVACISVATPTTDAAAALEQEVGF